MKRAWIFNMVGWILFIICALLYSISSYLARDMIGLMGGAFFLVGCITFIVPLMEDDNKKQ